MTNTTQTLQSPISVPSILLDEGIALEHRVSWIGRKIEGLWETSGARRDTAYLAFLHREGMPEVPSIGYNHTFIAILYRLAWFRQAFGEFSELEMSFLLEPRIKPGNVLTQPRFSLRDTVDALVYLYEELRLITDSVWKEGNMTLDEARKAAQEEKAPYLNFIDLTLKQVIFGLYQNALRTFTANTSPSYSSEEIADAATAANKFVEMKVGQCFKCVDISESDLGYTPFSLTAVLKHKDDPSHPDAVTLRARIPCILKRKKQP